MENIIICACLKIKPKTNTYVHTLTTHIQSVYQMTDLCSVKLVTHRPCYVRVYVCVSESAVWNVNPFCCCPMPIENVIRRLRFFINNASFRLMQSTCMPKTIDSIYLHQRPHQRHSAALEMLSAKIDHNSTAFDFIRIFYSFCLFSKVHSSTIYVKINIKRLKK